jgi:ribosomal protein S18 acetylase RimI-like enzyme
MAAVFREQLGRYETRAESLLLNGVIRSELESARFGVQFGRLDAAAVPPGGLADAIAMADAEGLQVLSARVDATELEQVRALEDLGFRIMDSLVYYRREISSISTGIAADDLGALTDLTGADAEACSAIARRAFRGYMGHYHADPRLSANAAEESYADWIARLLLAPMADQIAIGSAREGKLVGFLVGLRKDPGTSEILLNAVSPEEQRAGHYTALLWEYLRRVHQRGDREVVISTQLQNTTVQRVWVRAGFTLFRSYHTLHRWAAMP